MACLKGTSTETVQTLVHPCIKHTALLRILHSPSCSQLRPVAPVSAIPRLMPWLSPCTHLQVRHDGNRHLSRIPRVDDLGVAIAAGLAGHLDGSHVAVRLQVRQLQYGERKAQCQTASGNPVSVSPRFFGLWGRVQRLPCEIESRGALRSRADVLPLHAKTCGVVFPNPHCHTWSRMGALLFTLGIAVLSWGRRHEG